MQTSQHLNKQKVFGQASVRERIIAGIVLVTVTGFFVLLRLEGAGKVHIGRWLGPCGFQQRSGLPCPTCGVTTSAVAFAKGNILEAFYIQPAGAFLCCLLAVAAFLAFLLAVFGVYCRFLRRLLTEVKVRYIVLALVIVVLAGWAVTLSRALAKSQG